MARIARVVIPGVPHLVIQRGTDNKQVFFSADDYREYLRLVGESCAEWNVRVWAYCLLPNQVLIVVQPTVPNALARALGEAHRRYAKKVNERIGKSGRLWHARFSSCPLQPSWLARAMRFVERSPVDSGMLPNVGDYPWCSSNARLKGTEDPMGVKGLPQGVRNWPAFVAKPNDEADQTLLSSHERTGRPIGDKEWVMELEKELGRRLRPRKRGRKPKIRPVEES